MLEENANPGLIPDFFHDVIAYFVPGYALILLLWMNHYVAFGEPIIGPDVGWGAFFFLSVAAYIFGRMLGQFGYWLIHHRTFPFLFKKRVPGPKWALLFDDKDEAYSRTFKTNLIQKIEDWLKSQNGQELVAECKQSKKDDYFNLIQFYLRERFPSVALFEKKQNANLNLMRSLSVAFALNILFYMALLLATTGYEQLAFSWPATAWLVACVAFSFLAYHRYRLDQRYHAMYVFETFIAMKKLLAKKTSEGEESA